LSWITLIADLHGRLPSVRPDSYLLLLAGDIAPDKNQRSWLAGPFHAWLGSLPCPVVAVLGNHDKWLAENPMSLPWTLLRHGESCRAAGLTIWGNGIVLNDRHPDADELAIEAGLAAMPERTDVLLSHNPPAGILCHKSTANHLGSIALAHAVWKRRPRLCVFGHVHESRGHCRRFATYCVNATLGAGCDRSGQPIPAPFTPWGLADNSWRT